MNAVSVAGQQNGSTVFCTEQSINVATMGWWKSSRLVTAFVCLFLLVLWGNLHMALTTPKIIEAHASSTPLNKERELWTSLSFPVSAWQPNGVELYQPFRMVLTDENGTCLFLEDSKEPSPQATEHDKCQWAAKQHGFKVWYMIADAGLDTCDPSNPTNGGLFFFLGGHFGSSCLRVRAAGCRVVCVEPTPELYTATQRSALVNGWDQDGTFQVVPKGAGEFTQDALETSAFRRESGAAIRQTVQVLGIHELIPMDEVVECLTIDIDGHDGGVMKGLLPLLENGAQIRNIIIESFLHVWDKWDNISVEEGLAIYDRLFDFGYQALYSETKTPPQTVPRCPRFHQQHCCQVQSSAV